ncbi:MAG: ADP-ribosylglycohydrolase family protein [Clostridia bacterium]|nr:ADP-ribosylglycohydrolase family protein [Clostridia bacterium]
MARLYVENADYSGEIERAIEDVKKSEDKRLTARVVMLIEEHMYDGGMIAVPIETPQDLLRELDPTKVKPGEKIKLEKEVRFKLRKVAGNDGKGSEMLCAFTSDSEAKRGAATSVMKMPAINFFVMASKMKNVSGILLNPWGKRFFISTQTAARMVRDVRGRSCVCLDLGDITRLGCECIVNSAKSSLMGGGGVDGAIHRAAGPELVRECMKLGGCWVGEAKITKGYNLKAKYVIHTVGPIYEGTVEDRRLLAECYTNSLNVARKNNIHSIAFPAIATGHCGYPKDEAIPIALNAVWQWLDNNAGYGMRIIMSCFDEETLKDYDKYMVLGAVTRKKNVERNKSRLTEEKIRAAIYGLAVGDALGVPAEFTSREELKKNPITDMVGFGTHGQPEGTWSDDTSMTLCVADSIAERRVIDAEDIMKRFALWYDNGKYSPFGECFDVGNTTRNAIMEYKAGKRAVLCGGDDIYDNGNGSLMRTLPLVFPLYYRNGCEIMENSEAVKAIHMVSMPTHAHQISQSACGIYICVAAQILSGGTLEEAIRKGCAKGNDRYDHEIMMEKYEHTWDRLRDIDKLKALPESEIRSGGYVVDTLEAALWCLLNTDNYKDCVLKAVNLGSDTDTTAAVAGGLAGLYYGFDAIPKTWIEKLKGKEIIDEVCGGLYGAMAV